MVSRKKLVWGILVVLTVLGAAGLFYFTANRTAKKSFRRSSSFKRHHQFISIDNRSR